MYHTHAHTIDMFSFKKIRKKFVILINHKQKKKTVKTNFVNVKLFLLEHNTCIWTNIVCFFLREIIFQFNKIHLRVPRVLSYFHSNGWCWLLLLLLLLADVKCSRKFFENFMNSDKLLTHKNRKKNQLTAACLIGRINRFVANKNQYQYKYIED